MNPNPRHLASLLSLLFLIAAALPASATDHNVREIVLDAVSSAGGTHQLRALVGITAGPSSVPQDLSMTLVAERYRPGETVPVESTTRTIGVTLDNVFGDCESDCGPSCGAMYVDGVFNTMTCRPDGPIPGGFDCDCGHWLTANLGEFSPEVGDEIIVSYFPAPGAVPDIDTSNDIARRVFDGKSSGWRRELEDVSIVPNPTGGFDVTALVDLKAAGLSTELDLSTEVQLFVDGTLFDSKTWQLSNTVGGAGGDCETSCGGGCGGLYVDGVINTMTCRIDGIIPGGGTDCDCGHWLQWEFGNVPGSEGTQIELTIIPAPGAVPDAAGDDKHENWIDILSVGSGVDLEPNYDRRIHSIGVAPSATGGGLDVSPVVGFRFDGARHTLDLSTEIELQIDGVPFARQTLSVANVDATGDCETGCGGGCGGLYVDGHINTMTCQPDGPLPGGGFDCDCGYWLAPNFPNVPAFPGQTLTALLLPAVQAAPEVDPTNDRSELVLGSDNAGWNRSLRQAFLSDDGTGGMRLDAEIAVAISDPSAFHNLSFELQVLERGIVVGSKFVEFTASPLANADDCQVDCSGGACADYDSPDPQGTIAIACDYYAGFVGCACGSILSVPLEGLPPIELDLAEIVLRPVPGALPELPGFPEDDERDPDRPTSAPGSKRAEVQLENAAPNPFNPRTTIAFDLPQATRTHLAIYDVRGALVRVLADGRFSDGRHAIVWDGTDANGRSVASGVYIYRLRTEDAELSRKVALAQ